MRVPPSAFDAIVQLAALTSLNLENSYQEAGAEYGTSLLRLTVLTRLCELNVGGVDVGVGLAAVGKLLVMPSYPVPMYLWGGGWGSFSAGLGK